MNEPCTFPQTGLKSSTCPECGMRHQPRVAVRVQPVHYVATILILAVTLLLFLVAMKDPIALASCLIFVMPFGLAALVSLALLVTMPRWGVPMTRLTVISTVTCTTIIALFFITGLWVW